MQAVRQVQEYRAICCRGGGSDGALLALAAGAAGAAASHPGWSSWWASGGVLGWLSSVRLWLCDVGGKE